MDEKVWHTVIPEKERLQIQLLAASVNLSISGNNAENCGTLMIFFLNGATFIVSSGRTKVWAKLGVYRKKREKIKHCICCGRNKNKNKNKKKDIVDLVH